MISTTALKTVSWWNIFAALFPEVEAKYLLRTRLGKAMFSPSSGVKNRMQLALIVGGA
jgi:hypothetical protein